MSAIDDRITLKFICPKCHNKFGKLPKWLKSGGKVTCPKCGEAFVDEEVLKGAEELSRYHRQVKKGNDFRLNDYAKEAAEKTCPPHHCVFGYVCISLCRQAFTRRF